MPRFTKRSIHEERSFHQRRVVLQAIGRILANPIINILVASTSLMVMSNQVHAMMLGQSGYHTPFIFLGFGGILYGAARLFVRPSHRPFYRGQATINSRGWQ